VFWPDLQQKTYTMRHTAIHAKGIKK